MSLELAPRLAGIVLCAALATLIGCGGGVVGPSHFVKGNNLLDEGRPQSAIDEYRLALGAEPNDFRLHFNLASAYHDVYLRESSQSERGAAREWYDLAKEQYELTLTLDPGNARAVSSLAVLERDAGDLDGAIAILEARGDVEVTRSALPSWTLGTLLIDAGRTDDAIAAFQRALDFDPEFLPAAVALADHLYQCDCLPEARDAISKGLEVNPYDYTLLLANARVRMTMAEAVAAENADQADEAAKDALAAIERARVIGGDTYWLAEGAARMEALRGHPREAVRELWLARDLAADADLEKDGVDAGDWRAEIRRRLLALYPQLPETERP